MNKWPRGRVAMATRGLGPRSALSQYSKATCGGAKATGSGRVGHEPENRRRNGGGGAAGQRHRHP